jgi:hypothetical protein
MLIFGCPDIWRISTKFSHLTRGYSATLSKHVILDVLIFLLRACC